MLKKRAVAPLPKNTSFTIYITGEEEVIFAK
jgi:hypothetical protein